MSARNLLGATAATWEGHGSGLATNPGSLHYQFGRPAPFAARLGTLSNIESSRQNFAWAVKNPMAFVATGSASWTEQDTSNTYLWHDKNVSKTTDGKSIFDPSPIGWRLPIWGTYSDFTANATLISSNVSTYTPASASFYGTGYRANSSSTLSAVGSRVYNWFSTPGSTTTAYNYRNSTSIAMGNDYRSYGFALRAIRE